MNKIWSQSRRLDTDASQVCWGHRTR